MASSSSGVRYVCWEWLREDMLGLSPYSPEDSYAIERVYSQNRKGKVKLKGSEIDLRSNKDSLGRMVKRNTNITLPTEDLVGYWLWCCTRPDNFICYDIAAIVDIEKGFMDYTSGQSKEILNLSKCPSNIPYTINYANMNQTRHGYMTVREIKRVQLTQGQTLQCLLQAQDHVPSVTPLHSTSFTSVNPLHPTSFASVTPLHPTSYSSNLSSVSSLTSATSMGTSYGSGYGSGSATGMGGASRPILQPSVLTKGSYGAHYVNPAGVCPSCSAMPCLCNHFTQPSLVYPRNITRGSKKHHPPITATTTTTTTTTATLPALPSVASLSSSSTKHSRSRRKTASATGKAASSTTGKSSPTVSKSTRRRSSKKGRRKAEEEEDEESSGVGKGGDLMVHFKRVEKLKEKDDEPCPICMNKLSEQSGFDEEEDDIPNSLPTSSMPLVYKLRRCGHKMHNSCLQMYLKSQGQSNGLQCPTCKKSYGVKTGDMPDGSMSVRKSRVSLPGHDGYGMLQITYDFSPGVYNGRSYRSHGFPRTCYLPDSPKGNQVLRLLKVAWERRLTFTIGTSVTTGASDTVVWNEIHHKTESTSNHSGHGYPDPGYLERVLLELAAQGVYEKDQDADEDESSSDYSDA